MMNTSEAILTLLNIKGIGKIQVKNIIKNQMHKEITLNDIFIALINLNDKKKIDYDEITEANKKANEIIKICFKKNILLVNFIEEDYPKKLLSLSDYPVLLYYKGNIKKLNNRPSVAIIGTRQPSEYGMIIAQKYSEYLTMKNFNVISGLAKGIDGIAHKSCLDCGGYTVAFLGQGLNTAIYPKENRTLAERILNSGGALISEYEPNLRGFPNFFVERDRLQSGASDGVLVIETGVKGGTMHAVSTSINLGRKVAVLNHPMRMKINNDKAQGNISLMENNLAIGVFDTNSLDDFSEELVKNHTKQLNELSSDISFEQTKLLF